MGSITTILLTFPVDLKKKEIAGGTVGKSDILTTDCRRGRVGTCGF